MRILMLTASYAPVLGGLQTVTGQLACGLQALGHKVRVVTNRYPRTLPKNEGVDGILVDRKHFVWPGLGQWRRPHLWLEGWLRRPGTLQWLRDQVAEWQPDVINVHFPDGQIPYLLRLRQEYRGRLVVSLHGDEIMRFFGRTPRKKAAALIELLKTADAVTACSNHLLQHVIQLVPSVAEKGIVIHNGVDTTRFIQAQPYNHHRPYALAVGRLTHEKGIDMLLDAWAESRPSLSDLDLIIAGDGEERTALHQRAERLGISHRIHFFGRATSNEAAELMVGCQFVVIPSRQESFGIVAIEALAAGKPVLATRVGGLAELLSQVEEPLIARLVPPTVNDLANGIKQMSASKTNHTIPWPDQSILDNHSWIEVVRRYQTAFTNPV